MLIHVISLCNEQKADHVAYMVDSTFACTVILDFMLLWKALPFPNDSVQRYRFWIKEVL